VGLVAVEEVEKEHGLLELAEVVGDGAADRGTTKSWWTPEKLKEMNL